MIGGLLPASVTTVATRADLDTELFAVEQRSLGHAVEQRRREFTTGRACAHSALGRIGLPNSAVPSGARGEPLWPPGVVGSITHCDAYRACSVARARDVRSLGIDAEVDAPLSEDVLEAIASAGERRALGALERGVCADRLLFSAKEAIFKACYPLTHRSLGFEDVDVRIDPHEQTFAATLRVAHAGAPARLTGRWCVAGGIVATAVVVAR